ncbi:Hypothetical Protein FCC1311_027282 [Hondaea fermentalgiana]|uniref:Uncharacterized protein n=1 Tax=Hondaea fermentalgiana TaxID=2315210 RepID=A0A2R5G626_9STRA|nr:Hypothetical Protein FCC1311_027282 [Hondaea fermentalgiana]|eukprot:GBG26507.1 Hypothetical Protein FCC1311_027282 [Hondaea fermentalgiana]
MPRQADAEAGDGPQLRARKKGRCKGCQGPNPEHQLKREKAFMENREDWTWKMNTYKQELEIFNRHSRVFGVARYLVCCMDMRRDLYERDMVPFNKLSGKCYEPLTEMCYAAPFTDLFLKKRPSSDDSKRRRSNDFAEFSFQDRLLAMAIDFYKNQDCIIEELLRAQKKGPRFEHSSDAGNESVVDEVFLLVRAIIERKEGDIMESMQRLPRKYRLSPDELDRCMAEPDALVDFSYDYSDNDEGDSDSDDSDDNDEDEDDASSASPSHRPRFMSSASRTSRRSNRSSRGSSRGREVEPATLQR